MLWSKFSGVCGGVWRGQDALKIDAEMPLDPESVVGESVWVGDMLRRHIPGVQFRSHHVQAQSQEDKTWWSLK